MLRRAKLGLAALLSGLTVAVLAGAMVGGEDTVAPAAPGQPTQTTPRPDGKPVVLAFGGDVHFEGVLESKLAADPSGMLDPIEPVFRRADLAVVNLETAVTTGGSPTAKAFTFRTPATAFAALRGGGVDLASMANNHGLDYGVEGLRDSLAAAKRYRFPVVGIGLNDAQAYRPFRATVKGQRIAVIGATQVLDDELISAWTAGPGKPGLASAKDVPRLVRAVRAARTTSDTVVVFLHWGIELEQCPSADQRTTREGARRGRSRRRRRCARPSPPGCRPAGQGARRLRARQLRLVRDERALDADRRPARDGRRPARAELPLGARADRRRRAPATRRIGATQRGLLVALTPRLHRPEAVGPGLHFPAAGR